MKPIIGITAGRRTDDAALFPLNRIDISVNYANAVTAAGGLPIILPPVPGSAPDVLAIVDGLIFSGGSDLDPALFGDSEVHPKTYGIDDDRDAFELELARLAYDRDVPVMGICRGIQSVNVALGGTLHQHVPDLSSITHSQQDEGVLSSDPIHPVRLEAGSLLAGMYAGEAVETNSLHHQSINEVAGRLAASGWSDDGLVEAVEAPDRTCFFAVQWHPEMMVSRHELQLSPFKHLIEIAASRRLAIAAS
jgi:putative glutamine amidotransferase